MGGRRSHGRNDSGPCTASEWPDDRGPDRLRQDFGDRCGGVRAGGAGGNSGNAADGAVADFLCSGSTAGGGRCFTARGGLAAAIEKKDAKLLWARDQLLLFGGTRRSGRGSNAGRDVPKQYLG